MIELDRHYYRSWPRREMSIIGFDLSRPAVTYAERVGLLSSGISANLEADPVPAAAMDVLHGVDLVISTGSIGYITERSIKKILNAIGPRTPWFASFVLRMFPYDTIESTLGAKGLVTEKLNGVSFVQRRFQSMDESLQVLERLETLGLDPTGKEANGLLHAEFFISRPMDDRTAYPLESLADISQGVNRSTGRLYRRGEDGRVRLMK
ncbi:MAG: class I SAM-dependent methyltransferase [Hyphomicrobiaceae bacterium]|nr:class I SAM-dependent methyltransferase [Hyphomicrobiaceae bacterium]